MYCDRTFGADDPDEIRIFENEHEKHLRRQLRTYGIDLSPQSVRPHGQRKRKIKKIEGDK
jgi:hypothetical protein